MKSTILTDFVLCNEQNQTKQFNNLKIFLKYVVVDLNSTAQTKNNTIYNTIVAICNFVLLHVHGGDDDSIYTSMAFNNYRSFLLSVTAAALSVVLFPLVGSTMVSL